VVGGGAFTLDHLKRKAKGFYKFLERTRGEHRDQAASCLRHCQHTMQPEGSTPRFGQTGSRPSPVKKSKHSLQAS
jgi:hypothetical protein